MQQQDSLSLSDYDIENDSINNPYKNDERHYHRNFSRFKCDKFFV